MIVRITRNYEIGVGSHTLYELNFPGVSNNSGRAPASNLLARIRGWICGVDVGFDFVNFDYDGKDHFINVRLFHHVTDDQAESLVNGLSEFLSAQYSIAA